jgi:hypothetical protein
MNMSAVLTGLFPDHAVPHDDGTHPNHNHRMDCPLCGSHMSVSVNYGKGEFGAAFCHHEGCQLKGNPVSVIMAARGVDVAGAYDWMREHSEKGVFVDGHAYRFDHYYPR